MTKIQKKFCSDILNTAPKMIRKIYIKSGEIMIYSSDNFVFQLIKFLKLYSYSQVDSLSDICGVDYFTKKIRFEVVYNLLSIHFNNRIRIKIETDALTFVPSIVSIFPGANWYEREVWDMFGIVFDSHPDLRRILTDYGFDGFPLRKDFPLTGFLEIRYSESKKRLIFTPIQLTQGYRSFNFTNSWLQKNLFY